MEFFSFKANQNIHPHHFRARKNLKSPLVEKALLQGMRNNAFFYKNLIVEFAASLDWFCTGWFHAEIFHVSGKFKSFITSAK